MIEIILTKGIQASGKSTWARQEVLKNPNEWIRINNDLLREMFNSSYYSLDNESFLLKTRNLLIKEAIKNNKNIIIDNLNFDKKHFNDVVKIAKTSSKDVKISEKCFYIELEEAIERDSKRTGTAHVGADIIKKWWTKSGGKKFKDYVPRVEIITAQPISSWQPIQQDKTLPKAVIFDLDGTMCEISHRDPYDASNCELDGANEHVVKLCKIFYNLGYKIIFFSGREEKYKEPTEKWLHVNFGTDYELHMRKTSDMRKDSVIKKELFDQYVKDKYCIEAVVDDRLSVCEMWYEIGLPLFRVGDPRSNF